MPSVHIEFSWTVDDGFTGGGTHQSDLIIGANDIEACVEDPEQLRALMAEAMRADFESSVEPEMDSDAVDNAVEELREAMAADEEEAARTGEDRPAYVASE
jgi:hypothetical protein